MMCIGPHPISWKPSKQLKLLEDILPQACSLDPCLSSSLLTAQCVRLTSPYNAEINIVILTPKSMLSSYMSAVIALTEMCKKNFRGKSDFQTMRTQRLIIQNKEKVIFIRMYCILIYLLNFSFFTLQFCRR